jgi:hypothetical protein
MPGLVPGIHAFAARYAAKAWMAGTSPAMTKNGISLRDSPGMTVGYSICAR